MQLFYTEQFWKMKSHFFGREFIAAALAEIAIACLYTQYIVLRVQFKYHLHHCTGICDSGQLRFAFQCFHVWSLRRIPGRSQVFLSHIPLCILLLHLSSVLLRCSQELNKAIHFFSCALLYWCLLCSESLLLDVFAPYERVVSVAAQFVCRRGALIIV